jgi:hypothetical protein
MGMGIPYIDLEYVLVPGTLVRPEVNCGCNL